MSAFQSQLEALVAQMGEPWGAEAARLAACRRLADLERLAATQDGWLSGPGPKRLKLVRHGSGAYLVVCYEDGWSSTVARQGFSLR